MIESLFPRLTNEIYDGEGEVLEHLASGVKEWQIIVEVGCYRGRSTAFLAAGSQRGCRVRVWAVDPWEQEPEIKAAFDGMVQDHGQGLVSPLQGFSVDVAREFPGCDRIGFPKIGLAHIDGSHVPDDLRADIRAWGPMIAPGGVMIFHDFTHKPLRRVIDEEMSCREWDGPFQSMQNLMPHETIRLGWYRRRWS